MDIAELMKQGRFTFSCDSLGKLLVHAFSHSTLKTLRESYSSFSDPDPKDFVRNLMVILCELCVDESEEYTDRRISLEEATKLNDQELNDFSVQFLKVNTFLEKEAAETKDDVLGTKDVDPCKHLRDLLHRYNESDKERNRDMLERLTSSSMYSKSVIDMIHENQKLSNRFQSDINRAILAPPLSIPENPVHESNRLLMSVGNEFRETYRLISNMNDLALRMALEFSESSNKSQKNNKIMLIIGLVTIIFSVALSSVSLWQSNASSAETNRLMQENIELQIRTQDLITENNSYSSDILTRMNMIYDRIELNATEYPDEEVELD